MLVQSVQKVFNSYRLVYLFHVIACFLSVCTLFLCLSCSRYLWTLCLNKGIHSFIHSMFK